MENWEQKIERELEEKTLDGKPIPQLNMAFYIAIVERPKKTTNKKMAKILGKILEAHEQIKEITNGKLTYYEISGAYKVYNQTYEKFKNKSLGER